MEFVRFAAIGGPIFLVLEPQGPNEGYRLLCSTSSRLRKSRKDNFLMLLVRATGCGLGGDVICRPSNKQAAASSTRRHESNSAVYLSLQVTFLLFVTRRHFQAESLFVSSKA
jgi:hypothetical protein